MPLKHFYIFLISLIACVICAFTPASAKTDFTVVIDAGHGGKDVGAIDNNIREKDINLAVALRLEKILKKRDKNIKVVLTRSKDEYLTLQKRADIANNAKADLFISIHTNSLDLKNPNRKTVEGVSTYTLGLHKDKNNMDVARRENSVMAYESNYTTRYDGFDPNSDESYIIFEMAQKANLAQSVKFAEGVQKQMTNVAGRKDRGVKQAGFWVLWATSMPSVLVELDFITNPKVAEFLGSDKGQEKLAKAIGNATISYVDAIRAERRSGKQTRKKAGVADADSSASGTEVILASTSGEGSKRQVAAPQKQASSSQNGSTYRRRRNGKAREKSENREYEVAVISEGRDYVVDSSDGKTKDVSETVLTDSRQTPSKNKDKKADIKKEKKSTTDNKSGKNTDNKSGKQEKRVVNGRQVTVTSAAPAKDSGLDPRVSAAHGKNNGDNTAQVKGNKKSDSKSSKKVSDKKKKSETNSSAVRIEKKKVVYRIQILASEEHLKSNNPRFCGLSPVSCTKCDNLYKYTYGESTDRAEIDRMLVSVRKKIPDAFIVTVAQ